MSRRKPAPVRPGEELTQSYDSMLCVDATGAPTSRRKEFCPSCGLPRDAELALKLACGACGTFGTQKKPPVFDDYGDLVPPEVVEQRRLAQLAALQAARQAAREQAATPAAQPPKEASRTSVKQPNAQVLPKPAPKAAASTSDLFLLMM